MTSSSPDPVSEPVEPVPAVVDGDELVPGWRPVPQPPLTPIDERFLPLLRFQLDKRDAETVHLGDFALRPVPTIVDPHRELRAQRAAERAAAEGAS